MRDLDVKLYNALTGTANREVTREVKKPEEPEELEVKKEVRRTKK